MILVSRRFTGFRMEPRQLLRCAPHHVRSDFRSADTVVGGLVEARRAVAELKSRGVTRFLDLNRVNKIASMMSMMTKKLMKEKILESWNPR